MGVPQGVSPRGVTPVGTPKGVSKAVPIRGPKVWSQMEEQT
jgi:hypothetical protein